MSVPADKYRPLDQTVHSQANPLWVVVSLWLALGCLALVNARDLFALVALDDRVVGRAAWLELLQWNLDLAERTSLPAWKERLDGLAAGLARTPLLKLPPEPASRPGAGPSARPAPDLATRVVVALARPREESPAPLEPPGHRETRGLPAPRRILLVGASSIQYYLGAELERRLADFEDVSVLRLGKLSTGLSRPDIFDWPQKLAELQAEFRPDLVIAMFGGNDCQPIRHAGRLHEYGTPGWQAEYRKRLRAFVDQMQAGGARAVLLGQTMVAKPAFAARLRRQNDLLRDEAEAAGALFVPTWDLGTDERGRYRATIRHRGRTGLLRLPDGIHLSLLGADFAAERLVARLQRAFDFTPPGEDRALVRRHDLESTHRQERTSYLAFVPPAARQPGAERLPLVLLLHGADGDWTDWSEQAHADLERLSAELGLVVVTPDGRPRGWYLDSPRVPDHRLESYLLEELLPDVERRLPVDGRRGIAGLSMGGAGALVLGLNHPGVFACASSMSGAVDLTEVRQPEELARLLGPYPEAARAWHERSPLQLARAAPERFRDRPWLLTVGRQDRWHAANRALSLELALHGVAHDYGESDGGHDWDTWRAALATHLRWHQRQLVRLQSREVASSQGEDDPPLVPIQPTRQPKPG